MGPKGPEIKLFITGNFKSDLLIKEVEKSLPELTQKKFLNKPVFTKNMIEFYIDDNFVSAGMNSGLYNSEDAYRAFKEKAVSIKPADDLDISIKSNPLFKMILQAKAEKINKPMLNDFINDLAALKLNMTLVKGKINLTALFDQPEKAQKYHTFIKDLKEKGEQKLAQTIKEAEKLSKTANLVQLLTKVSNLASTADAGTWVLEKLKCGIDTDKVFINFNFPEMKDSLPALMPAIAVAGVMAAIAVPNFSKARNKAQTKACIANMRVLEGALEMYDMDGGKIEAGPVEGSLAEKLVSEHYIKALPQCKAGGKYSLVEDSQGIRYIKCSVHGTIDQAKENK
jgi:competence protein ComGC